MDLRESMKYVLGNIYHRKLRTFLTVLAIVIGIASIVVMISLGQGIKKSIDQDLQKFSPRTVFIIPGDIKLGHGRGSNSLSGKLYEKDVNALQRIPEIEKVTMMIMAKADLEYRSKELKASVYGMEMDKFKDFYPYLELESGRYVREGEKGAMMIGSSVAEDKFDKRVEPNSRILVNGKPYTVVGIFKESTSSMGGNPNDFIIMDYQDIRNEFKDSLPKDEVMFLYAMVREGFDVEEVAERMEYVIKQSHKLPRDRKDFTVFSPKVISDQVNQITDMITMFLGSIATISLIVGAIGITNTMFSSVLERTKEIGTLKALGATDDLIGYLFLVESSILSMIGGMAGVALAVLSGMLMGSFGVPYYTSPEVVAGTFVFSVIIGLAAGYFPAMNAARLNIVSSLRYE